MVDRKEEVKRILLRLKQTRGKKDSKTLEERKVLFRKLATLSYDCREDGFKYEVR